MDRRQSLMTIGRYTTLLPVGIVSASIAREFLLGDLEANAQAMYDTKGYPGDKPRWLPIAKAQLSTAPYNRVCQVRSALKGGSGWLASPGVILTAAHVVSGSDALEIRLANRSDWISVTLDKITDGYFAPDGLERKCSSADVARLKAPIIPGTDFTPFKLLTMSSFATAIGFRDGELVAHSGTFKDVGPFIGHNCDTEAEHSGCPLFEHNAFAGIHVGLFSGSRPYLSGADASLTGYLNSAVRV